ncbi:hypothetical protein [Endozoicomonas sp. Mp262]|uniref:hypothetical protein n=1 Tax=Endozoicomonas sp. Mp262 TaxID=2919499 RepID=UPI0021D833D4
MFVFLTNFSHATGYYKYRKDLDARAFPTVCQTIEISSPTPADDTWDIGIVFLQLVMPEGYELSSSFSGDIMQKLSEQYVYSHPADILTYFLCWQPLYPSLNFKYISLYQYAFGDAHRLFKGSETKHCLSRRGFEFMCKMFETDRDRRLWPSQLLKESYLKKTVKDLKKLKAATKEKERKKTLGVVRDDSTNKLIIRKLD